MRTNGRKQYNSSTRLGFADLDVAKATVRASLRSAGSRRCYELAITEFIGWYCSEPRLGFNKVVVTRYRMHLESRGLSSGTVNLRLAAVSRLAYEAADSGLLSPEQAAGIRRVKGAKKLGVRFGNWLVAKDARALWELPDRETLKGKRDRAILSLLLACGLRRGEVAALDLDDIQRREDHWAIVDLAGKGGHVRTVPVPDWVTGSIREWVTAAGIRSGKLFRCVCRAGKTWGDIMTDRVVWHVVKDYAAKLGLPQLAPHHLRRSCARLCHVAGGELWLCLKSASSALALIRRFNIACGADAEFTPYFLFIARSDRFNLSLMSARHLGQSPLQPYITFFLLHRMQP